MADNPDGQSCGSCAYFKDGACRLNPPAVLVARQPDNRSLARSTFPEVATDDWCGAWKTAEA